MIKTMKSGLSCSYEAICLREGEKANSGVRQVGRAKADTKAHTTVDDDDNGDSHELTATFA